jgi:hypothetical protein
MSMLFAMTAIFLQFQLCLDGFFIAVAMIVYFMAISAL